MIVQIIVKLSSQMIGLGFIALIIALIAQWATKKVAKFKPSYGITYKSVFLGTVAWFVLIHICAYAVTSVPGYDSVSGMDITGKLFLITILIAFLIQSFVHGKLIKDPTSTSIGVGKRFGIAGIQFAIVIGLLSVFMLGLFLMAY